MFFEEFFAGAIKMTVSTKNNSVIVILLYCWNS